MSPTSKHPDHDYIVARQDKYIEAYHSGSGVRMMEFMDKDTLKYSDIGAQREEVSHDSIKDLFDHSFANFHDLKIETLSLNGHKRFTAWEYEITCKAGLMPDGTRLSREEAHPTKLKGCTLMWWNDKDKIIRNHDYTHATEP